MISTSDTMGRDREITSIQDLANQLPEADALPDGFSEGPLDSSDPTRATLESPKQTFSPGKEKAVLLDPSTGLIEVGTMVSSSLLKDFADLGFDGRSNVESSLDTLADSSLDTLDVSGEITVNQSSDIVSSSPMNLATERSEKVRRFPVPLSQGDSAAPVDLPPVLTKKSRQGSRLDHAEGREFGAFEEKRVFDRLSESAKARKQHTKEVRLMLDGNTRSSDEKVQLLNQKYQQQVAEIEELEKVLLSLRDSLSQSNKQKNTVSADLNRNVALRQKLESLCRELQRQNKILLDESKKVAAEEQQKRQELSTKFHDTIKVGRIAIIILMSSVCLGWG
ncbi:hypothetical protein O6H91_15G064500 [Diphasiastrum complanatum]|uniref:Uncharacterized protein n=1 Tax=Diphasiastrum complanatum TaxID=34168 RepID=A0ACC2BJ62_DIPCM|nr:hypothetical protein O6H91_15G064500 [Diphasiastrum complanatum]